jgi:hypothetical protein
MPYPSNLEYAPYFQHYIDCVPKNIDIFHGLVDQNNSLQDFFCSIPKVKLDFQYAIGKWTAKEILQHLIDCERVFAYRALSIARGESQNLLGFDENEYATQSFANVRSLHHMLLEFDLLRKSSIALLESFNPQALLRIGIANEQPISANAIAHILLGHCDHHIRVIKSRYLKSH